MAVHRTVESFVGSITSLPAKLEKGQQAAVRAGALHVTTHVRRSIESASGGDSRLSGVGRSGAKVGAGFTVRSGREPYAVVQARGPVHLIERPTKPHEIPRARRRRGGSGRPLLAIGGNVVTGPVQHPGTRGKGPFSKGVNVAFATVGRVMHEAWRRTVF